MAGLSARRAHAATVQSTRHLVSAWPRPRCWRSGRLSCAAGQRAGFVSLLSWLPDDVVRQRGGLALFARAARWRDRSLAAAALAALVLLAGRTRLHGPVVAACRNDVQHGPHLQHGQHAARDSGDLDHGRCAADQAATAGRHFLEHRRSCRDGFRWHRSPTSASFTRRRGSRSCCFSGPSWANGTSLQLWTYLWGRPWSPTTQLILSSRTFTQVLQVVHAHFRNCGRSGHLSAAAAVDWLADSSRFTPAC